MLTAVVTGALAGIAMGYVLQRSQLCFHAMFAGALTGSTQLLRGWLLGVAIASVGLAVIYATSWSGDLNQGLAFRPVGNILGGLVIGVGMVVAQSCASGLFYKLGSGMYGAAVGLAGWAVGELAASRLTIGGPTVLSGGFEATIPGVLGVPRTVFAPVFLVVVGAVLLRTRPGVRRVDPVGELPRGARAWGWPAVGAALGLVTIVGWLLADLGGSSFGPSTVGAVHGVADASPNWWLVVFLLAIVAGAALASRTSGGWSARGETAPRYLGLALGGFLLGAGGWVAGGCNLGHGLSGAAQLNVSSWVVVAAMATGVLIARMLAAPYMRMSLRRRVNAS